ncbi:hypothetical protein N7G274_008023 [Stereocaulon virgatum]|uniref:Uncharacterized protein n=1 Tax=Stereocaulon virgatum TaxID=373712 RepID=A0ABR4A1P8_9LECA
MHLIRNLKIRNHTREAKSCGLQYPPRTPSYIACRLPACSSMRRLGLQQRHLTYHPSRHQLRRFYLPTILYPPLVFTGLVLALWAYKCLMMIIFQNKIIYMPSMPPYSRSERIASYEVLCRPVVWREERIKSADGVEVALAVGSIPRSHDILKDKIAQSGAGKIGREVVILYFQGNGSSLPPRLPGLSQVLKSLATDSRTANPAFYTIAALSYRGFWTSRGRPSEHGVNLDAAAVLA